MENLYTKLTPRLVVADAQAAIHFYVNVFGAQPGTSVKGPNGKVVHAELDMGGMRLSLTESDGDINRDPRQLGGTSILLVWYGDDPDAVQAKAQAVGAKVIFPVADRPYGMRDGRFEDASGHQWLVTKTVKALSERQLQEAVLEQA